MSENPDPAQPDPQPPLTQPDPQQPPPGQQYSQQPTPQQQPPEQPYAASAPTQVNPQFDPPPWQDQQQQDQQQQDQQGWQHPGQQQQGQQQPGQDQAQAQALPQAPPVPAAYGYGQYGGQPVPPGMYLDQESGLMLPQGTRLATPARRIGAFFLAIPLIIVTLVIGYVIWGLIVWANGQTPALQLLGMRCFRPETNRIASFWWMALREIVGRFVESILGIITELISLIFMITRRDHKAIHDLVAGTVVLYDPDKVLAK
jgi:uncharacterized RDD family membrane protein YckC